MVLGSDVQTAYRLRAAKSAMTTAERRSAEALMFVEHTHITSVQQARCSRRLHSLAVSPVNAIQNQQRKSSTPTKNSKLRNEKDEGEDVEKTGESIGKGDVLARA